MQAEQHVILLTNGRLIIPTPFQFLIFFINKLQVVPRGFIYFTHYLLELSMNYFEYPEQKPSFLAAASIVLARLCIMPYDRPWPFLFDTFGKRKFIFIHECI